MRTRAWAGRLFLGIGLCLLTAPAVQALIIRPYPLASVLDDGTFILIAKVDALDAGNLRMILKADEHLKGKGPFSKMPVVLRGDADAAKEKHTPQFLKRLAVGLPLVLFVNQKDKDYLALGYTNGTWFQLTGTKPDDADSVRWSFTHLEPYMRRAYKGTTAELRQVIAEVLAGKSKPPAFNAKEAPGFGPELPAEKPSDKPKSQSRLKIHDGPQGVRIDNPSHHTQQSESTIKIHDGPLFGVIALPTLAGPLAVLAMLFPSLFGGWKRWLAVLSVVCTTSTISFAFWLFAGFLSGTMANPLTQWLFQACAIFLGCAWAWHRYHPGATGEQAGTTPGRTELIMLLVFSLLGVSVLLAGRFWFRVDLIKDQLWLLIGVICAGAIVATAYLALLLYRGAGSPAARGLAGDTSAPRSGLPREAVMLSAMTLFAIALTATQQTRGQGLGGMPTTSASPGELVWTFDLKTRGLIASAPLVAGDATYVAITHEGAFGTSAGAVYCLDSQTGAQRWSTLKSIKMGPISLSTPVLANGRLYIGEGFHENRNCQLRCLDAATGQLLWAFPTASHVEASPSVVDKRVYFGAGDDGIFCVDAGSGKEIWHFPGLHVDSTPLVDKGRVYAGSGIGDVVKTTALVCLDAASGEKIWQQPVKLPAWGAPERAGDLVYFGIGNGRLNASDEVKPQGAVIAVAADTGTEVWRFTAKDTILCRPAVDERRSRVYFGSRDGFVYCVDRLTGKLCWKRQLGSPVVTEICLAHDPLTPTPLPRGERGGGEGAGKTVVSVYALAEDGQVWCLEPQAGQLYWARDLAQGWYKLSNKACDTLLAAGVPQALLSKLDHLKNQEFTTKNQLLAELEKSLDNGERERYQKLLVQHTLVRFSEAALQLWSAPAVTVAADGKTQVRRLCFGVNIVASGTVPMICCFEDRFIPSEDEEDRDP